MQFDELLAHPTFWEQIWFDEKIRDRDLPEPVKLHQPHLISGTVALADITEQTRVYHYILMTLALKKINYKAGIIGILMMLALKNTNYKASIIGIFIMLALNNINYKASIIGILIMVAFYTQH